MRLAVILALLASPAYAVPACGPHDDHIAALSEEFGETVYAGAMDVTGAILEITVNRATGTWTIVITRPGGQTCSVTGGANFTLAEPPGDPA